MHSDARRAPRSKCYLKAQVCFGGGIFQHPVLVKDMSEGGARLAVADDVVLPDTFELRLPNRLRPIQAMLRWRHMGHAGVSFQNGADLGSLVPVAASTDEQLRIMIEENARLRQIVEEMNQTIAQLNKRLSRLAYEEAQRMC